MLDKVRNAKLMKEAFEHVKAIEEAETIEERINSEREWKEFKDSLDDELMEKIKSFVIGEVVRMAREDPSFRKELAEYLVGLYKEEGENVI